MAREVALDQPLELRERHAFDGKLVEQAAEFAREFQRLRRRLCNGMALVVGEGRDQLGQQSLALGRIDGRRQRERIAVA